MNERNTASEARASIPVPTPVRRAWKPSLSPLLASLFACCALPSSRRGRAASPGSCRLPARASARGPTPGSRCPRRSSPRRRRQQQEARKTIAAAAPRAAGGAPGAARTSGESTAATTPATTTGTTIVLVSAASQIAPTRTAATPTSIHDGEPEVAQPLRRREDAGQLDRLELDDVRLVGGARARGPRAVDSSREPWGHQRRAECSRLITGCRAPARAGSDASLPAMTIVALAPLRQVGRQAASASGNRCTSSEWCDRAAHSRWQRNLRIGGQWAPGERPMGARRGPDLQHRRLGP